MRFRDGFVAADGSLGRKDVPAILSGTEISPAIYGGKALWQNEDYITENFRFAIQRLSQYIEGHDAKAVHILGFDSGYGFFNHWPDQRHCVRSDELRQHDGRHGRKVHAKPIEGTELYRQTRVFAFLREVARAGRHGVRSSLVQEFLRHY